MENLQLKNLDLLSILTISTKLTASAPNSQIAATLILPFSLLFLLYTYISHLLFYSGNLGLLFDFLSVLSLLLLSLLPISVVAFSISSHLTTPTDPTFPAKFLFSLLPNLRWKCLFSTLLAALCYVLVYTFISLLLLYTILISLPVRTIPFILFAVPAGFYFYGLMEIGATWLVAIVMSVLEDLSGNVAMAKSHNLLRWHWGRKTTLFFMGLFILFLEVGRKFTLYVLEEDWRRNTVEKVLWEGRWVLVMKEAVRLGFWARFGIGLGFAVVLTAVSLFRIVVFTVVYFVCKSSSREGLDMLSLADRLKSLEGMSDYCSSNETRKLHAKLLDDGY